MSDWFDQIKRDLNPFADPGSQIQYGSSGRWMTASWTYRRMARSASFDLRGEDEVRVMFNGAEMSYQAFLASEQMSDLLGVAGMILQSTKSKFFVETRAKKQEPEASEQPALGLLSEAIFDGEDEDTATNVVFVTGDAGAGKTEVLRQLVLQQAERYVRGEADYLFLYVNAQGRALARLEEALATEIQDLRAANLTYHVVPTLARNNVLIPVIDGFDELLGVLGYEDAFSSLRRFLDDLNGRGSIIASARSTYYQQEFISRSGRESFTKQAVKIDPIEILPWGEVEFREYLNDRYISEKLPSISMEEFRRRMLNAFASSEDSSLQSKPFFVAKTADMVLSGQDLSGGNLLEQLVDGYVERERTEKLLNRNGSPLLSSEQIRKFVQQVGEEMWVTETRSLDQESIRIIAELVFDGEDIGQDVEGIVRERAATMAFFSPSSTRSRIEFEHQLFFSYFLGSTIYDSLEDGEGSLFSVLSRARLPEYSADFAAKRLQKSGDVDSSVIELCCKVAKLGVARSVQTRENAGSIVSSLLHVRSLANNDNRNSNEIYHNLLFAGNSFSNINFENCQFIDVEFRRTEFSGMKMYGCVAERVMFEEVMVDTTSTHLDISGISASYNVSGLRVRTTNGIEQVFRHDRIAEILSICGMTSNNEVVSTGVDPQVLDLLEKVLRKFEKSNLFWPTDHNNKQVLTDEKWKDLESLLIESGMTTREESLQHKGVPRYALRRNFLPQQIMSGDTDKSVSHAEIRKFWAEMRTRFPELPE